MKNLLTSILLFFSLSTFGQGNEQYEFFAQGMLDVEAEQMIELQSTMRSMEGLQVVRLDHNSNRFFILTNNRETLTELEMLSWFGDFAEFVRCAQVGRHGYDEMNHYPFPDCEQ